MAAAGRTARAAGAVWRGRGGKRGLQEGLGQQGVVGVEEAAEREPRKRKGGLSY